MSHSWSTSTGNYSTNASSPAEMREQADRDEERYRRNNDERGLRRVQIYRAEADRWEAENQKSAAHRTGVALARRRATLNQKDSFIAQYGGTSEEREAARARIARRNQQS